MDYKRVLAASFSGLLFDDSFGSTTPLNRNFIECKCSKYLVNIDFFRHYIFTDCVC